MYARTIHSFESNKAIKNGFLVEITATFYFCPSLLWGCKETDKSCTNPNPSQAAKFPAGLRM